MYILKKNYISTFVHVFSVTWKCNSSEEPFPDIVNSDCLKNSMPQINQPLLYGYKKLTNSHEHALLHDILCINVKSTLNCSLSDSINFLLSGTAQQ